MPITSADADLDALTPATPPWIPATVPGDVQSDLLDTGELPDPRVDLNSRLWEWTSQRDWVYVKEFELPASLEGHMARIRFDGVDYSCHVFLNGTKLGSHEGTYTSFEMDASMAIRAGVRNRLVVVVEHAPVEPDQQAQIGWTSRVRLWKPRFAYKWDWCTRLIPLGIYDDVWLETWNRARVRQLRVTPQITRSRRGDRYAANVAVVLDRAKAERLTLVAGVYDSSETCVARESLVLAAQAGDGYAARLEVPVQNPELWYPNGYGPQNLYTVRIEVTGEDAAILDSSQTRIGFREVRVLRNYGAPEEALPYTLEVNGRKVFAKGWNWAPVDQLYGRIKVDRYRHAIRLAKEAHCNLLRVWGGGLLERECFYDLCDEAGIMVWQEFHQSSSGIDNQPATDPEYVEYCAEQARNIVPRRSHHPSLIIWCGGNELMDAEQRPNTLDHPVLAALGQVVREEDPERIYLPTSPHGPVFAADPANADKMEDVHGHWLYLGDPKHYEFYNAIDPLFHSEFGCEGAANLKALERFLSPRYQWPPDRTNPAWVHHGNWWLHGDKVTELFGPIEDLRTFVHASQFMQYEGLRYIAEANRRRKWRTSGCAPWQFNESWPNASCTNCLDYYGGVRPAYWGMRNAYAPRLFSLRYNGLRHAPGSEFTAELWMNLSLPNTAPDCVRWVAWDLETCACLGEGRITPPKTAEDGLNPVRLSVIGFTLPAEPRVFGISVWADGEDASTSNRYVFSSHEPPIFARLLHAPMVEPVADRIGADTLRITCPRGHIPMLGARAEGVSDYAGPYLSWGYAPFVMPGEAIRVSVSGSGAVEVSAANAEPVRIVMS
jgi:beta-mannosidase